MLRSTALGSIIISAVKRAMLASSTFTIPLKPQPKRETSNSISSRQLNQSSSNLWKVRYWGMRVRTLSLATYWPTTRETREAPLPITELTASIRKKVNLRVMISFWAEEHPKKRRRKMTVLSEILAHPTSMRRHRTISEMNLISTTMTKRTNSEVTSPISLSHARRRINLI